VATARELAGDRVVAVTAGDIGGQALALGLVDEVAMDVVPVVFGSGKRYFGPVDAQHLLEDPYARWRAGSLGRVAALRDGDRVAPAASSAGLVYLPTSNLGV
jgi:dihydrofolate reductase